MNKAGEWGEILACRYLRDNGYTIVETNFRTRFGEIDVISKNKNVLVFTEVKARTNISMANPCEYVDENKQKKIILASASFIQKHQLDMPVRFDVAEIYFKDKEYKNYKINYIKDAFRC